MPLVKSICRRCIDGYHRTSMRWQQSDESYWRKDQVVCLERPLNFGITSTKGDAPAWCRYALEHAVLSQEGGEKT